MMPHHLARGQLGELGGCLRGGRRLDSRPRARTARCRLIALRIVCGSMPCSRLYAIWIVAAAVRLVDRQAHRVGDDVGVHDHLARDVARRAPDRLDEAALVAQEALLVGVEDRDERDLRQVESLAQQVDADEAVERAHPQVAQDLHALERADVAVQVARLDPLLDEVVGEVLGHLLGERRDEHALVPLDALLDLADEVVDLAVHRPHDDLGVDQPGGADDLLDDLL